MLHSSRRPGADSDARYDDSDLEPGDTFAGVEMRGWESAEVYRGGQSLQPGIILDVAVYDPRMRLDHREREMAVRLQLSIKGDKEALRAMRRGEGALSTTCAQPGERSKRTTGRPQRTAFRTGRAGRRRWKRNAPGYAADGFRQERGKGPLVLTGRYRDSFVRRGDTYVAFGGRGKPLYPARFEATLWSTSTRAGRGEADTGQAGAGDPESGTPQKVGRDSCKPFANCCRLSRRGAVDAAQATAATPDGGIDGRISQAYR